ncbi:MFS transporter [Acidiferrimicrobium sp. IK]|uniref:MFS transporter n=1 Tax=Acidiferrimicrobium sp. IK TaxID=2871700 RepID=UPI0021CB77D4|nr:MFS transporter [Acidiferrimicrobium sp. IK]MCU4184842.1 MFS transporter [Acidiferrimicrobium sp. IK]
MTLRLSRHHLGARYRGLWVATGASSLGDGLVFIGFPLLALSLTHDPLLIAGVTVAGQLPAFLIGPIAGAVVDRTNRRRLALIVEVGRLLIFAAFAGAVASGHDSLPLIYLTLGALGCGDIVFKACTVAALPAIVASDQLEAANGGLGAVDLTSRELAGQGLGGLVFELARPLPFLVDALSFAVSAVLLRRCLPSSQPARRASSMRQDIAEGFWWFIGHRELRSLALVIGTFAFAQSAVLGVLVLYATGALHTSRAGYGVLLAVGSVGAIGGSLIARRCAGLLGPRGSIVASGVVAGLAYLLLAGDVSVVAAGVAVAAESASVSVGNVASMSLRQRLIPDVMMGRVAITFRMVLIGSSVLGALAGGLGTTTLGLRPAFALAGAVQLAVLGVAALGQLRQPKAEKPVPLHRKGRVQRPYQPLEGRPAQAAPPLVVLPDVEALIQPSRSTAPISDPAAG